MSRSAESCTTCVTRQKKCDGSRPICRRCTRDHVGCGGFSSSKNPIRGVSDLRKTRTGPFPTIGAIDLPSSGLVFSGNYSGTSWSSNISSSEPGTPSEWSNTSSPAACATPTGQTGYFDHLQIHNPQSSTQSVSIPRQAPAPPYHPTDIGPFDEVTRTFLPPNDPPRKVPKKDVRQSLTPGQASLFDALFSLGLPEDNSHIFAVGGLTSLDHNTQVSAELTYGLGYDVIRTVINRPMNFRYDTTFIPGVYRSVFDLENGPGIRWAYGIPDRLVIMLARMNALLEDFGSAVDPRVVKELEMELRDMKMIVVTSADPSLGVGRLVVQECWRQAAYIYLYMALCGADSHDARVVKAHGDFMEIFIRTKPGRILDSFLVFPLPILGIATRHPDDQELLKRRLLTLPEVSRKGTAGNQFITMLDNIWGLVNESGRPTTWSDLRLASLYVAGV